MTNYNNKEFNKLKILYERFIKQSLHKDLEWHTTSFCMDAMDLLEEYHIKEIQYKARIKALKELLKEFNSTTLLNDYNNLKKQNKALLKQNKELQAELKELKKGV